LECVIAGRTNAELTAEVKRSETQRLDAENEVMRLQNALDRQLTQCKQLQVINRISHSFSTLFCTLLLFNAMCGIATVGCLSVRPSVMLCQSLCPFACIADVQGSVKKFVNRYS